MPMVLLFTQSTGCGAFRIETDSSTFDIKFELPGMVYALRLDTKPDFVRLFPEPYEAIRAVAEHRTGIREWDASSERVSDYALDWQRHPDKRFQMNLLDSFLNQRADESLRSMVDYFESRHSYIIDRMVISDLLKELMMTGQIDHLPSMHMAPAEFSGLKRFAKHWLRPTE